MVVLFGIINYKTIAMVFITVSPQQAKQYSYISVRLKRMVNKMYAARKTLEAVANTTFDKAFAKCMYMFISESLQCENEIRAQIDSLNCGWYENNPVENKKLTFSGNISGMESICNYAEKIYLKSYKKLLQDKHFGHSLKCLIQNHLQLFMYTITQLRLFNEVKAAMN